MVHSGCYIRYNKNNVSKLNCVHSGNIHVSHHDMFQTAKGLESFSERSSLKSSLWVHWIGSHVVVFRKGLVDECLVFAILIVGIHSVIKVLNGFGSPVGMVSQVKSFKVDVFMIKSKVLCRSVLDHLVYS